MDRRGGEEEGGREGGRPRKEEQLEQKQRCGKRVRQILAKENSLVWLPLVGRERVETQDGDQLWRNQLHRLGHFHSGGSGMFLGVSERRDSLHHNEVQFSSVVQSCRTLRPHGLQHARLPCVSPAPKARSNSCPSNRWCHPTISSSVLPFSSCHQCYVWSWWGYCLLLLTPPLTGSHWEAWILSYLSILKPWHNARVYVRISKWPWRIHLNAQELSWNFLEVSCLKLQSLLTIQLNLGTSCDWAI